MALSARTGPCLLSRVAAFGMASGAVAAALGVHQPHLLANTTPSEPPGLYRRVAGPPRVGRLVAFRAPPAARAYIVAHLAYLRHASLLKGVAAGPGDRVCTTSSRLLINGKDLAPIADRDRAGQPLPRWRSCRALAAGELFVFSRRVPNSFDSRYFGPVAADQVLGVYAPLAWPWEVR